MLVHTDLYVVRSAAPSSELLSFSSFLLMELQEFVFLDRSLQRYIICIQHILPNVVILLFS